MQVLSTEEIRETAERLGTFALLNEQELGPVHHIIYIASVALGQVAEDLPELRLRCNRMAEDFMGTTEGAYSDSRAFLAAPLEAVWEAVGGSEDGRWTKAAEDEEGS
jgi:hypothetical protein